MFSATKFVVAGVIVALFGGFLLSGVLTQPSDESVPAVGASASASAVATRTDEGISTLAPEPTPPSPVLPGAELDLEQVAPGVFQVHGDGVRDLTAGVRQVVVGPSDDVWVEIGGDRNSRVVRLGEPGVSYDLGSPRSLGMSPDGAPLIELAKRETLVFDGEGWVAYEEEIDRVAKPCAHQVGTDNVAAAHGACWVPVWNGVDRHFDGGSELVETAAIGLAEGEGVNAAVTDDDGTLWLTVHDATRRFSGLVGHDGETWTRVPYEPEAGSGVEGETSALAVGPDGMFWVQRVPPFATNSTVNNVTFTTWDGDTWTSYGPVETDFGYDGWDRDPAFGPDGTVWFYDGRVVFDGEAVRRSGLPEGRLVQGPTGTFWKKSGLGGWASRGPLLAIDPKAVAAAGTEAIERSNGEEASTTNPDLLPGVGLVTEEVRPGVYRILNDGAGHDLRRNVWGVEAAEDGTVFIENHRVTGYAGPRNPGEGPDENEVNPVVRDSRIIELGKPGVVYEPPRKSTLAEFRDAGVGGSTRESSEPRRCMPAPDGACWRETISGRGHGSFGFVTRIDANGDEQAFTAVDVGFTDASDGESIHPVHVGNDGTVWVGNSSGLARYDGESWMRLPSISDARGSDFDSYWIAPDETAWAARRYVGDEAVILSRWDGTTWSPVPEVEGTNLFDFEMDVDGVFWVMHGTADPWDELEADVGPAGSVSLSRWENGVWSTHGPIHVLFGRESRPGMERSDDGTLWLGPLTWFDGTELQQIELPSSDGNGQPELGTTDRAPNGLIWLVVEDHGPSARPKCTRPTPGPVSCQGETDGLYVITPEAVAATE